jgi:hypothetical protein
MTDRPKHAPTTGTSSSATSTQLVADIHTNFAEKDALVTFLNELLEAERAGARITRESAAAASIGPLAELLREIQRDEARWCAMLSRHLKALGERPSQAVGTFYEKAMVVVDLRERVAFLNRGQGWVARKLREILPRVRDARLLADLTAMLVSHKANIGRASDVVGHAR